jgi:hypothetical protein
LDHFCLPCRRIAPAVNIGAVSAGQSDGWP